jgi:trk system potassium uptake protein TrkA
MPSKIAVIGLGQFGSAVAKSLAAKGAEVMAIDQDIERVEDVKDDVAYAVALDATDSKALASQNISDMDAVLVAIGENIEGLLLTVVQLLDLRIKRIIARAMTAQQRTILEKLGVREIIMPDEEIGNMVSEMLINPEMKAFLSLPDNYEIVEIQIPRRLIKRTLVEINMMEHYGLDLIAIKRKYEEYHDGRKHLTEHLIVRPNSDTILEYSDVLVVLGKADGVDKFVETNK